MTPEASGWQVACVGILLLALCLAMAHAARRWHDKRAAPPAPEAPAHVAVMRRELAEAELKAVEFDLAADHSRALAVMYYDRVEKLSRTLAAARK